MRIFVAFPFFGTLLCVWLAEVGSLVVTSLGDIRDIANLSLASNLEKFIKHEEKRLKVIHNVSRYEDEEPLVFQRIKEFKILHKDLVKNQTANKELVESASRGHPTSVFAVLRNFVANWNHMLTNTTLYGTRLQEFLKADRRLTFPGPNDMHVAGTAINIIMTTYNVSLDDVIKGNILGHKGQPLNAADCYDIAKACLNTQLVDMAKDWIEAAFTDVDLAKVSKDAVIFNMTDALVTLSKIVFEKGDSDKAIQLLEQATELDPDDHKLHQLYLQYRFGRDVKPLPKLNTKKMERWRSTFFALCGNATLNSLELNMTVDFRRRKCRYRPSIAVPYRRYQEEILSFAPFISVIYDFVSPREIANVKNATKTAFFEVILPGNDKATLWQYKALAMRDTLPVIKNISYRIGDVTGLDVSQSSGLSRGEPVHIMDYGIAGTCLPHSDNLKTYAPTYMGYQPANRLATVQVFMSDTKAGGEVVFFDPLVTVKPRMGMALLSYNYRPDGRKDERAYSGTCPLAMGENLVLEKGIWSTGLDSNVLCGHAPNATFVGLEKTKRESRSQPEVETADDPEVKTSKGDPDVKDTSKARKEK